MANNNLSFAIAINLLTSNFKRGANYLKSSFRSIQMQAMGMVGALGLGGIGLSNLVSSMIEISRQTSRVNTSLKNVSGSSEQFAKNQKFLIDLSSKYGIYVNDLVGNFSKFTAAANGANMSLENQYKIFDALSKASVAFGMNSEQTNRTFIAITQMMAKGKISAEMRGQLGENLPVAMNLMAKAAKTDAAGLEKLMKAGKLTADVLIPFADELNKSLGNIDTNSLESSINRLKNIFKNFVDSTGVQKAYQFIITITGNLLTTLMNNFQTVSFWFVNIITTIIITKGLRLISAYYEQLSREAYKSFLEQGRAANLASSDIKTSFVGATKTIHVMKFALMGLAKAFLPLAILSGLIAIIQKVADVIKKRKEIDNLYKDFQKREAEAGSSSQEIVKLKAIQEIMNNKFESQKNIQNAQAELQKMLGVEGKSQIEINKLIEKRIELIKASARAELYANEIVSNENRITKEAAGKKITTTQAQDLVRIYVAGGADTPEVYGKLINKLNEWNAGKEFKAFGGGYNRGAIYDFIKTVGGLNFINKASNEKLKAAIGKTITTTETTITTIPTTPTGGSKTKSELQQAEEEYTKSLDELQRQIDNGAISQADYNEKIDEINKSTFEKLGGLLSVNDASKNVAFQLAKYGTENKRVNQSQVELVKQQNEYNDALADLTTLKEKGIITEIEFNDEVKSLIESTLKSVVSIDNIGTAADEFVKALLGIKNNLPKAKDLSKYDYKSPFEKIGRTDTELLEINLDQAKQELADLKEVASGTIDDMTKELNAKWSEVIDLDKALRLNDIKTSLDELKKELNSGIYNSVKNVAESAQSVYQAFKSLSEVITNTDASGFEKLLAVFSFLTSTIDTVLSVSDGIQKITSVTKAMTKEKENETAINAASAVAKLTSSGVIVATNKIEQKSSEALTKAYTQEMLAKTGGILFIHGPAGFPMALLQSGLYTAMINSSNLQKFAAGGIVKGNSTFGDNILIRANAGEMLLNHNQQSTLFNMLNGSGSGGSKQRVEFVIEGKELKGVLDNYNKIKNKVK